MIPATDDTPTSLESLEGLKAKLLGKRVTTKTRIIIRHQRRPDAYYEVKEIIPDRDALIVSLKTLIKFSTINFDDIKRENPSPLFVADAYPTDEGRGVVRMELSKMLEHRVKRGDKVLLFAPHRPDWQLGAYMLPVKHFDIGLNLLRIDYSFRGNLQISVGQSVQIKPLPHVAPAEQLTIKPTEERVKLFVGPEKLKKRLVKHLVTQGQVLMIKGKIRLIPPKDHQNLKPKVKMSNVSLVIDSTDPAGIVEVNQDTQIIVKERI